MTAYSARFRPGKERNAPAAMIAFAPGGSRNIFLGSSIKNAGKMERQAFYTRDVLIKFLKTVVHTKSVECQPLHFPGVLYRRSQEYLPAAPRRKRNHCRGSISLLPRSEPSTAGSHHLLVGFLR